MRLSPVCVRPEAQPWASGARLLRPPCRRCGPSPLARCARPWCTNVATSRVHKVVVHTQNRDYLAKAYERRRDTHVGSVIKQSGGCRLAHTPVFGYPIAKRDSASSSVVQDCSHHRVAGRDSIGSSSLLSVFGGTRGSSLRKAGGPRVTAFSSPNYTHYIVWHLGIR